MTDKEKLELINLRKRVESQRDEIKRLTAQLERNAAYTKELEVLCCKAVAGNEDLEFRLQLLTYTA